MSNCIFFDIAFLVATVGFQQCERLILVDVRKREPGKLQNGTGIGICRISLTGTGKGTELQQRWGPRPDSGDNVRLRYFYFSLEATGHITSRGHGDFFATSF
jgi:hypothetical protein